MHGYQLRKMAGRNAWLYPIRHTSIYAVLHELARDGLVEYCSELHDGRARKVYSLTEAGRRELDHWAARPLEADFALSDLVAFKVSVQPPSSAAEARKWMQQTLDQLREHIRDRETELARQPLESPFAALAFEHGIEVLRLRARLLERAIETGEEGDRRLRAAKLESV